MPLRDETEAAFDRWMRESLRERYGPALGERLPEGLVRLLDAADWAGSGLDELHPSADQLSEL